MANVPAGVQSNNDFDTPVVYDALIKSGGNMSDIWVGWFTTFYQTLITYLSQNGIFAPQLTTLQRDTLNSPIAGQIIYNSTTDKGQMFIITSHSPYQGDWVDIT